ncbi:MuF-C-terminal domain-containing protein [Rhodanobacter lindaniclasticus]
MLHSRTEAGSYVVLTDMKDGGGRPIVVAIKPEGRDAHVDVHVLTSSYGKDRNEWFDRKGLVYLDHEKARGIPESDVALFRDVEPGSQGLDANVLTADDLRKFRAAERARALDDSGDFSRDASPIRRPSASSSATARWSTRPATRCRSTTAPPKSSTPSTRPAAAAPPPT